MLPESAWILKTYNETRRRAQLCAYETLSSRFQSSAWVMSCFSERLWRGELSPGMPRCPRREPTAESAQRQVASRQCSEAGHCLFGECLPLCGPQQASGSHQNKIRMKAGAGWRGEEDGGVPASPYLKEKIDNWHWKTKLEISGSIIIIKPVFKVIRVFEIK